MTLDQLIEEYCKSPQYTKLAESSQGLYKHCIHTLQDNFRKVKIADIKRSDLVRLSNKLSNTPASANLVLRVASVLFSFAIDIDALPYNPAARVKKLKIGTHERWHPEEVKRAIGYPDRVVSAAVALAWYTGQREGDILRLQWKDYRNGYINLIQTKTKLEMGIKAHADVAMFLDGLRNGEPDHYYIVSGAKPIRDSAFRGRFSRAMERLGLYKTFHGIRKGVACELAEKGRSTKEIAAILGHKTTRMAEFYADQACGKRMAANAVDSLTGCL